MEVTYSDNARQSESAFPLLERATRQLEEMLGSAAAQTSAAWDCHVDSYGQTWFTLTIFRGEKTASTSFLREVLNVPRHMEERLRDIVPEIIYDTYFAPDAAEVVWIEKQSRPTWIPIVEHGDGELTDSKFSGLPWLAESETWPCCRGCRKPMQLMLQLDLDRLPSDLEPDFGPGLLQLFYCTQNDWEWKTDGGECPIDDDYQAFSRAHLIRTVRAARTKVVRRPEGLKAFPPVRIVGWTKAKDYPSYEDYLPLGFDPGQTWGSDTMINMCRQFKCLPGDKLWGWPQFIQGREYPTCPECRTEMTFLFQLDSQCNLPWLFGDVGCGHITLCPIHRHILAFQWACS
jgi:uncharacterized protein YwqG